MMSLRTLFTPFTPRAMLSAWDSWPRPTAQPVVKPAAQQTC
jgi:hypothetical protein